MKYYVTGPLGKLENSVGPFQSEESAEILLRIIRKYGRTMLSSETFSMYSRERKAQISKLIASYGDNIRIYEKTKCT